jgi:hypothetical protein
MSELKMANIFEEALASIGVAISDVREKVVEEGWFGRAVTDGQSAGGGEPTAPASNAFEQALAEILKEATASDRSHDTPEPGGGMER